MKNLLNMLLTTVRARIMPLWLKFRMWTSTSYLRTRGLSKVRDFFASLMDVRPRHKRDYYPLFRWLVSKRLAFALVIGLGVVSALYISTMLPTHLSGSGETPTYRYRSLPLKFHSGTVNILGKDGYLAYTGQVDKGAANGTGTLYAADGSTVYEGSFAESMYSGQGTLYYENGSPQYVGNFAENQYNGVGSYYRSNGVLEYSGDHVYGVRTGTGTLYNSVGSQVFQGSFLNNEIVFHSFLDRTTAEAAEMYTGRSVVYQNESEYCVAMPEIDALYAVKDGSTTLENEWTVDRVYVLRDRVPLRSGESSTLRELQAAMGEPLYFGTAWVTLPEAVAWNLLAAEEPDRLESVELKETALFDDVFEIESYDQDFQVYLYTFQQDGLLYTFYFTGAGESEFVMYAVESA